MKPWQSNGPAQAVYDKYLKNQSLRDQWVAQVRQAWGSPDHPGLTKFPEVSLSEQLLGDRTATVFTPPQANVGAFLYLHGGGWMTPLAGKHLAFAKALAARSGLTVYALDYRLAPEHPFPAAFEDCVAAYKALREQGIAKVVIGGDSSGGNLAAAVCHYCSEENYQKPDKLLALCPMMDFFMEQYPSLLEFGVGNPLADMSIIAFQRFCYLPNQADWRSPYASPVNGSLKKLPETLVLIAGEDPLRDDNLAFVAACKKAGAEIIVELFPGMPHSFFNHADVLPKQCEQAMKKVLNFLSLRLFDA